MHIENSSSTSLVARVGQIITLVIMLGVISMISLMLVTESLSGDAAQINKAGALRMQAMRISRAYFIDKSQAHSQVEHEIAVFDQRLDHLLTGGLQNARDNKEIEQQYQQVLHFWQKLKHKKLTNIKLNTTQLTKASLASIKDFNHFVDLLDKLVSLLQQGSEQKLSLLRLIQGISLLSVLIISVIILVKLNKSLIVPLKQLVNVANEAGKGNFDLKAEYSKNDELGVLAFAINQMSSELKLTYQDFEHRVAQKTLQLTRSNQSLEVLYLAARQLTSYDSHQQIDTKILNKLEHLLGFGRVSIELSQHKSSPLLIDIVTPSQPIDKICFNHLKFPLQKQTLLFGYLIWQFPKGKSIEGSNEQLLQTMADIIATAVELDQKRNAENRLLIMEERAVIARELHDSLAQSLSYLKVKMSLLTRKMQKERVADQTLNNEVEETITDIKEGLNGAYLQLRELLTTFRLKQDDPSLKNSLQGTIAEFTEKCHHPIKFFYKLSDNFLNANQEIHLLQIVREALSNVHRHANACNAGISITHVNNHVTVEIWDDGQGLPPLFSEQGHFGLGIMEERAKSLHTSIHVKKRAPKGTKVQLNFTR